MIDDDDDTETYVEQLKSSRKADVGINWTNEMVANKILADDRRGTTKHSEMNDYLSPSQLLRRVQKEVYPGSGVPDESLYSGIYKRVHVADKQGGPRDGRLSLDGKDPEKLGRSRYQRKRPATPLPETAPEEGEVQQQESD